MVGQLYSGLELYSSLSSRPLVTSWRWLKMGSIGCSICCLLRYCGRLGWVGGGGSVAGWVSEKSRSVQPLTSLIVADGAGRI